MVEKAIFTHESEKTGVIYGTHEKNLPLYPHVFSAITQ